MTSGYEVLQPFPKRTSAVSPKRSKRKSVECDSRLDKSVWRNWAAFLMQSATHCDGKLMIAWDGICNLQKNYGGVCDLQHGPWSCRDYQIRKKWNNFLCSLARWRSIVRGHESKDMQRSLYSVLCGSENSLLPKSQLFDDHLRISPPYSDTPIYSTSIYPY